VNKWIARNNDDYFFNKAKLTLKVLFGTIVGCTIV
jgi:hypothetical protein